MHGYALVVRGCGRAGPVASAGDTGRDDQRGVAGPAEMLDHPDDGVADPVHVRQERFGDDGYSHDLSVGAERDLPGRAG
ncbi:hypothetical protein G419_14914 [Rhodococcus triatomae BKS 15-14]|nr:hypothetical protein G419_14914 [Rhodococcus triatomae BKS 15-14]